MPRPIIAFVDGEWEMKSRRNTKKAFGVLGIAVGLVMLAGCSAAGPDPEPEASSSTSSQQQVSDSFAEKFPDSQVLADCLNEKGWDVTLNEATGGVGFEGTTEQVDQYEIDQAECAPEDDSIPLEDFTSEQWTALYEMELETTECLRAEGIAIEGAPSEQVFIDRYTSADPWMSYAFVGDVGSDRWDELNRLCPQPAM
ncbi:MAG: hypothetical protein V4703_09220 [Actinomycetota bacterium]